MKAVRDILEAIGEDPEREGLRDTPLRIARMFQEIFSGLEQDPRKELTSVFNEDYEEMVIINDIPIYSMCEHHLLPFHGKAHVAYLPKGGRVVG
ncbi:MAG: GTP cyclohydrolase I, partial [Bacillota bacterium]